MPSIFGWGGVKIGSNEFSYSTANVSFEKVDVRNYTISGSVLVHAKGWRPVIDMELVMTSTADCVKLGLVISDICYSQEYGQALTVYPRYTSTDAGSLMSYPCFIDSNFAPDDIAKVDVGQTVSLRFIGDRLYTQMPTNYSGMTTSGLKDETDNLYTDESGNHYIIL